MSFGRLTDPSKAASLGKLAGSPGSPLSLSKFVFVTGGVISSVGKGIATSFIGAILKSYGHRVTAIKIDPYINIDAGTFSPYEHGEVFVLNDGAEVDLDLGNYERMLDICLTKNNNITTGKIYDLVINNERQGRYLGKTVQVIPHITDAIQNWLYLVASAHALEGDSSSPNICMVEVGGVVGDIESMPFLEAIRQFQNAVGRQNFCHIHLSPILKTIEGEQKTKPTQMSIRQIRSLGIHPDFIFCRGEQEVNDSAKNKISLFCDTPPSNIISMPNMPSIFALLPIFHKQNIVASICARLQLNPPVESPLIYEWFDFAKKCDEVKASLVVAIVGKYVSFKDAYHSIASALFHASIYCNRSLIINWISSEHLETSHELSNKPQFEDAWKKLKNSSGVLVPGGFDKRGVVGKFLAIQYCRENRIPVLGICLGLQVMIIEFARNVLNLEEADSTEMNLSTRHPVVIDMPEFNPEKKGGTMRLGVRKTLLLQNHSHTVKLYNTSACLFERHRHRFEFNINYKPQFEEAGLLFVGHDETATRMEIVELPESLHPFFVGVQFHPEFLSRPLSPAPLFIGLIRASIANSLIAET